MKRRPLNSVTLATATHKELIGVSNGTGAQVGAYIICKSPPRKEDEKGGENTVEISYCIDLYLLIKFLA